MPASEPFADNTAPSSSGHGHGDGHGRSSSDTASPKGRAGRGKGKDKPPSTPTTDFNVVPATPSLDGVATVQEMIATPLRDLLTGIPQAGISTNFVWLNLSDSRLKGRRGAALWDQVVELQRQRRR